jgi:MoaA/NifB/PqqE/SkfB family radical SAM enzyme
VIHLYEIDWGGEPFYWEAFREIAGEPWQDEYVCTLEANELEEYLDILRSDGVDFVLHTQEEYDEYHIALPSV